MSFSLPTPYPPLSFPNSPNGKEVWALEIATAWLPPVARLAHPALPVGGCPRICHRLSNPGTKLAAMPITRGEARSSAWHAIPCPPGSAPQIPTSRTFCLSHPSRLVFSHARALPSQHCGPVFLVLTSKFPSWSPKHSCHPSPGDSKHCSVRFSRGHLVV